MKEQEEKQRILKIVVCGGQKVGKTSILQKYIEEYKGLDMKIKTLKIADTTFKITFWDTNSNLIFQSPNKQLSYSNGIIIVLDLTQPNQLQNLTKLYQTIEQKGPQKAVTMVLGNKCEQKINKEYDKIKQFVDKQGILYIDTSAAINYNIDVAMHTLIKQILSKQKNNFLHFQLDALEKIQSQIRLENYRQKPMIKLSDQQQKYVCLVRCVMCSYIPQQPFETECCNDIYCQKCQILFLKKNYCQNCDIHNVIIKKSKLAEKLISKISIKCPNECGQTINIKYLKNHEEFLCDMKILECKICQQSLQMKDMFQHYEQKHMDLLYNLAEQIHEEKEEKKQVISMIKSKEIQVSQIKNLINPQIGSQKNRLKRQAIFGNNGKFYCKVKIKLSKFQTQCNQVANCDSCMQLDILRLGLKQSFLLNCSGYISKYYKDNQKCCCGRHIRVSLFSNTSNECTLSSPCTQCGKLRELIKLGLYRQFI